MQVTVFMTRFMAWDRRLVKRASNDPAGNRSYPSRESMAAMDIQ